MTTDNSKQSYYLTGNGALLLIAAWALLVWSVFRGFAKRNEAPVG